MCTSGIFQWLFKPGLLYHRIGERQYNLLYTIPRKKRSHGGGSVAIYAIIGYLISFAGGRRIYLRISAEVILMQARFRAIFVLTFIFALTGFGKAAYSGLIMEQVNYQQGSNDKEKVTIFVQGNKFKQVENSGPFSPAVIFDLESGDIMFVNDEKKLYIILNRTEYLKYI
jgi:hypothetical protein